MVLIFPNLCLWRRSLRSNLGGIDPEKLYRATLRMTIFNIKEQLQSFHFDVHIRISCTDCLLSETLKQKVLFSSESGQSKNFQTLLCKMMKNKKTHVN